MATSSTRGAWSGSLAFVLAAAGAAVGLGNIWKFPFITGMNGGGAFVLIYLLCIAFVGMPLLVSEMMLGRKTQKETVGAFTLLGSERPGGKAWGAVGWLAVLTAVVLLSYYSVVAGWTLGYLVKALTGSFGTPAQAGKLFGPFVASPGQVLGYHAIVMALTVGIVVGGVKGGLEIASKVLMPALFLLLLGLMGFALTLPGASEALRFLFWPDFSKLTAHGLLEALGHSFFTLSLGMGTIIVYGSYLSKGTNLAKTAMIVAALDTMVALLAGVMIFSIVFSFDMEPSRGPSLIFETMPVLFTQLPAGGLLATAFFLLLFFAALTSAISILEVVVSYLVDSRIMSRTPAALASGALIFALGILSALSFGPLADRTLLPGKSFFDSFDYLVSNVSLPLGGLFVALFTGWVLTNLDVAGEFEADGSVRFMRYWRFCVRIIAPAAVIIVLLNSIGLIKLT